MGITDNRVVKWLREFSKTQDDPSAKDMADKSNVEEVVKELEAAADEITTPAVLTPMEEGEGTADFVIPRPINLELADKYAEVDPAKTEDLTGKVTAAAPVALETTDLEITDKAPPEPAKLDELVVKEAKVDESPLETNPEEPGGLMGDIFQQDEVEENSSLRDLIASLPPVTVQELMNDMVEVRVLMGDWNNKDAHGKGVLPSNSSPGLAPAQEVV